ncbi:MAG: sigma-70 family RNA polymerase sigma factor [Acidobacteria bacterium]|nr:sigma-70 family RNA polymerase sigma factor [Acidobacteriota bacterium]
MSSDGSVTLLLQDISSGNAAAADKLIPLVYTELRRLADSCLRREKPGHTLQPTALVHEAYMRMVAQNQPDYQNRAQFYCIAARVMRQVLVDHARKRRSAKRGGGGEKIALDDVFLSPVEKGDAIVDLDDALSDLEKTDPQKARLIEMKYFGGLTAEESAVITGLAVPVIRRELRVATAWLQHALDQRREALP